MIRGFLSIINNGFFMTKRKLISLSAFILFASLTVTGILMYVFPHTTTTASIHTLFGFIFIGIISVHLLNNWKPFKNYLKSKTTSYKFRAIVVLPLVTILIIFGIIKEYPGFNSFYNWGNEFRASQEGISKNDFLTIQLNYKQHMHLLLCTSNLKKVLIFGIRYMPFG